jgi:hypothetical protein
MQSTLTAIDLSTMLPRPTSVYEEISFAQSVHEEISIAEALRGDLLR